MQNHPKGNIKIIHAFYISLKIPIIYLNIKIKQTTTLKHISNNYTLILYI